MFKINFTKIKKWLNENYKLLIPIALMIVLFISFLIYYAIEKNNNTTTKETIEVYQYFYDELYNYEAQITKNKKNEIVDYQPLDQKVNLDSTPIYDKKNNTVIFPKDMSVIMPTIGCAEYLSTGYSYIQNKNGVYTLITNNYHGKLNHYFLYDGKDLYYFIEPTTLKVDDKEISLSSGSYVIAKYKKSISYYNKEKEEAKTIETTSDNATITSDYYKIYISKDNIEYDGLDIILTSSIQDLNTIDKKDKKN